MCRTFVHGIRHACTPNAGPAILCMSPRPGCAPVFVCRDFAPLRLLWLVVNHDGLIVSPNSCHKAEVSCLAIYMHGVLYPG